MKGSRSQVHFLRTQAWVPGSPGLPNSASSPGDLRRTACPAMTSRDTNHLLCPDKVSYIVPHYRIVRNGYAGQESVVWGCTLKVGIKKLSKESPDSQHLVLSVNCILCAYMIKVYSISLSRSRKGSGENLRSHATSHPLPHPTALSQISTHGEVT